MPTAEGELYLAGEGISEGYIGREDLTEAAFYPDIYFPQQRMYKTGDLGRLRADGRVVFLGRRDGQVKINGQRVELSEIANAMLESGAAARAAVIPVEKPDGAPVAAWLPAGLYGAFLFLPAGKPSYNR